MCKAENDKHLRTSPHLGCSWYEGIWEEGNGTSIYTSVRKGERKQKTNVSENEEIVVWGVSLSGSNLRFKCYRVPVSVVEKSDPSEGY